MCYRRPENGKLRLEQMVDILLLVRERWQAAARAESRSQRRATSLTRGECAGLAGRLPLVRHPDSFVSAVWSDAMRLVLERRAPDDAATESTAKAFAGARPLRAQTGPHTLPLDNSHRHSLNK